MKPATIAEFYRRLAAQRPAPQTELEYRNPYTLLVAVVLSAQATDVGVNKATRRLFAVVDAPAAMLKLGEAGLKEHIKTIGLFNTKAKNVIALSKLLIERHSGDVPRDRAALEALPGVGRKTANVVLNVAFGEPTIAVDTHIFRVANRTGLARGKTPLEVEQGLEKATPAVYRHHAHHWLILHGRHVCKARKPDCPACPVRDLCDFEVKTGAAAHKAPARRGAKAQPAGAGRRKAMMRS
ncbi:MAG: endonuclease III [Rhodospirillales bacterium]|nr:endonuclease III [Rhodospirillales bacterium]